MAVLKQIKVGTSTTPIAQTVVTAASDSVVSVVGTNTELDDDANPSYKVDLKIDNATLVKSTDSNKVLKVGTVPAAQVSVATGTGLKSTDAQDAFKELKADIDKVDNAAKSYTIVKNTEGLATNIKEQYKLQETVGGTSKPVGEPINIYKDGSLDSVELVNQELVFKYNLATGEQSTIRVDVSTFLAETEFKDGLQVNGDGQVSVKIDSTSETFLTVGEGGVKLAGVQNAINNAVAGLNVTDTAEPGQYVSSVSETNGIVSTTKANVSDAVLNGYKKGTEATAILATDSLKVALGKLENQVDKAKAAATTKVAKDNAASHLTLASSTADDGSTTYTIGESDIASKTALDAEIAARKAVDGQTGNTYTKNSDTNYISGATSLNDADVKLDAALKAEETRAQKAETSIDAAIGLTKGDNETRTYTNTGVYIGKETSNTVASDIKALDTNLKEVADGLAAVQYKVTGTTLEFFGISPKTA